MSRDQIAGVVAALRDQRDTLAGAELDPGISDEAAHLISEAIMTLEYRRHVGSAVHGNVARS